MRVNVFVLAAVLFLSFSGLLRAEDKTTGTAADQTDVKKIGNKICPVSGEKVGQMGDIVTIEYKGKIYNLCCEMCKKDFNKDPDKYTQKAEEEAASSAQ